MKNNKFSILLLTIPMLIACGHTASSDVKSSSEVPQSSSDVITSNKESSVCEEHIFVFDHSVEPCSDEQGYDVYKCSNCTATENRNFTGQIGEIDFDKTYRVFYIGNSYTFFNNSWDILKRLALSQGINVETDQVTNGGWTLTQMANPNDTFGKKVINNLATKEYDIVLLQEQSLRPAIQPVFFYDAVRELHEMIEDNGARDVLYETWGRKTGNVDLETYNMTNYTMTQKLMASYGAIGEELGIPVSHAGAAFYKVYSQHPEIELYDGDYYHPSPAGSYLLSLVHFSTIFGLDPRGTGYLYFRDDTEKQAILENAAYEAVFGESILTDEYKTSSVGVTTEIDENDLHIVLPEELPTEIVDSEYKVNNGTFAVNEVEGKVVMKSTSPKSTLMLKEELFADGGEVSFTFKCDGAFSGASEQGIILGSEDNNTIYTASTDLYGIIGRRSNGYPQHTIIRGSTIMNDIANVMPDNAPCMEANTEYRLTIKVDLESNIYKLYVGEDLAMISYSPMNLHGGYIGFTSGINGAIEVKDVVVNGKYVNVIIPEEIKVSAGYINTVKLSGGDTLVFNELAGQYEEIELFKHNKKTVGELWASLKCNVTNYATQYRISDDLEFAGDDGEWKKVSDHLDDIVTTNIKFSIGRYRAIGAASNNNCNLNGGQAVSILSDNRIVVDSTDSTRRWGALTLDLAGGATFSALEFNYVEDIEITRNDATCNTQWAVQINNPIAGQRCTYNWDGTVDEFNKAKVYYKQNSGGSFTPSTTDSFFMVDTTNDGKTIKMRIVIYSNQMATEPYISTKKGIITYDAYPYGAEVLTDDNELHPQVVKNLSGFASVPATVNCAPEVINAKMVIKVCKLEAINA